MSLISFKNIKLFRSSASPRPSQPPPEEPESAPAKWLRNPFVFIVLTSLVLAYFLSSVPTKSLPEFKRTLPDLVTLQERLHSMHKAS